MAVANTKSTTITNLDATPPQLTNRAIAGADLKISIGICEVLAADDNGSVYRFARLPSNAVIHAIEFRGDAITAATDYDCGVYQTALNGGAVVDADLFASAIDINAGVAGSAASTLMRWEAATTAVIDFAEYRLWQLLDAGAATLASDPNLQYDICLTGNTVGTAAGTLFLRVIWSV